tara:strand:- start:457 stop:855 length:399 start_codon:yes stop_codon:yes gene_type:complete
MASFNKVILLGNLVADVEARTVGNEKTVADATIAVNDGFGENQEVSYIDMTLWERDAKFASQYLSKGAQVLVEGRLKQDRWQDKETGKTRSKIKLIVNRLVGMPKGTPTVQPVGVSGQVSTTGDAGLADLPF